MVVSNQYQSSQFNAERVEILFRREGMHIDAVVIGAIVSVVLTIVVIGVIGYRIMKNLDDK